MPETHSVLGTHFADWAVLSDSSSARRALQRWALHHPGVLAGFHSPAELIASFGSFQPDRAVQVLNALSIEAGVCEIAARTLAQALRMQTELVWRMAKSRYSDCWPDPDDLAAEVTAALWAVIRKQAGQPGGYEWASKHVGAWWGVEMNRKVGKAAVSFLAWLVLRPTSDLARSVLACFSGGRVLRPVRSFV